MSELLYSHDIASRLGWKIQTFRNRKRALVEQFNLPAPAALPGRERWLAADIDAWMASRGQAGKAAGVPASRPGEHADPAPAKGKPGRKRNPVSAGGRE